MYALDRLVDRMGTMADIERFRDQRSAVRTPFSPACIMDSKSTFCGTFSGDAREDHGKVSTSENDPQREKVGDVCEALASDK